MMTSIPKLGTRTLIGGLLAGLLLTGSATARGAMIGKPRPPIAKLPGGPRPPRAPLPGGGTRPRAKPLPPLKWSTLEAGLARGRKESVPVAVVFTTGKFNGPGTFHRHALRASLKKSKAVPVRVLPPTAPKRKKGAGREDYEKALADYRGKHQAYCRLARKYGARTNPTVVFLAPDGAQLGRLFGPDTHTVNWWLLNLAEKIKLHEKKKTAAARKK